KLLYGMKNSATHSSPGFAIDLWRMDLKKSHDSPMIRFT
ncbi:MAG: hypothetical protein ACI90V_014493, partial [Bacillariaceae sp.]